ncbi:MAG: zinc ABC transporter substrate-binding protein [Desulfotignum sp.]|nr:zinc ABC transporter substrate-binding protein [Desulfotignum sp.]
MRLKSIILSVLLVFLTGAGLNAEEKLQVFVSIVPQKYFVEQITGDLAEVAVLVTPGKSPATYSPTPAQIKKLANSDVYFRIGSPFENGFMHKVTSIAPDTRVVDTRKGIVLRKMEAHIHDDNHQDANAQDHHGEEGHAHGADAGHDYHEEAQEVNGHGDTDAGRDPHIWMSPMLAKQQAANMVDALVELAPEHEDRFRKNYDAFAQELDRLHERLKTLLAPLKGHNFFVFHPAFGYFADAYGLQQIPVETMGRSPKGKELSAIIKLAKQENARVIFVQPQFDQQAAQKIADAINGAVVSINPLAYDYLDNMVRMADTITTALAH